MYEGLLLVIALLCAMGGAVFVLRPRSIATLEGWLNRPWGDRQVSALRVGIPGERAAESWLNQPLLARWVAWDARIQKHPLAAGAGLWCIAALLLLLATAR